MGSLSEDCFVCLVIAFVFETFALLFECLGSFVEHVLFCELSVSFVEHLFGCFVVEALGLFSEHPFNGTFEYSCELDVFEALVFLPD